MFWVFVEFTSFALCCVICRMAVLREILSSIISSLVVLLFSLPLLRSSVVLFLLNFGYVCCNQFGLVLIRIGLGDCLNMNVYVRANEFIIYYLKSWLLLIISWSEPNWPLFKLWVTTSWCFMQILSENVNVLLFIF